MKVEVRYLNINFIPRLDPEANPRASLHSFHRVQQVLSWSIDTYRVRK
jgi:hypothetical protein